MSEAIAEAPVTSEAPTRGAVVSSNFLSSDFLKKADESLEKARLGLQGYFDENNVAAPEVTLNATNDFLNLKTDLQIYSATMTPADFDEHRAQLQQQLDQHPVLGAYKPVLKAEHMPDGRVTVKANVTGLSAGDYEKMIIDLADQLRPLEVREENGGSRPAEVHALHEKMIAAGNNLKAMILAETDRPDYPSFTIKIEPAKSSNPDRAAITLSLASAMDRKQAVPVMGALVRAFNRKRRTSTLGSSVDDFHELEMHEGPDGLHMHIDNIPHNCVEQLLDNLSKPLMTIAGGSVTHLGAVNETQKTSFMSN